LGLAQLFISAQRDEVARATEGSVKFSDFFSSDFLIRLSIGNLEYVLLIVSMLMTRMVLLRAVAISSGIVGATYSFYWLGDPVGTFWEVAFTLVNVGQLALISYRNISEKFTDDEAAFYKQVVPSLQPHQVRRLIRTGMWLNADPGTELIRQGEIVSHLIFLKSGAVEILFDGKAVALSGEGSLVGELGIRAGKPASATVIVREPARCLALQRKALRKLMNADSQIAHAIDNANQHNLEAKLMQMNRTTLQAVQRLEIA
jgi:CRP-like cAMP-binding protein